MRRRLRNAAWCCLTNFRDHVKRVLASSRRLHSWSKSGIGDVAATLWRRRHDCRRPRRDVAATENSVSIVYSAMPYVIQENCIDCMYICRCILRPENIIFLSVQLGVLPRRPPPPPIPKTWLRYWGLLSIRTKRIFDFFSNSVQFFKVVWQIFNHFQISRKFLCRWPLDIRRILWNC